MLHLARQTEFSNMSYFMFYIAVGLLDRPHETEELLNMKDVDVIDLQADGSAVSLSGKSSSF